MKEFSQEVDIQFFYKKKGIEWLSRIIEINRFKPAKTNVSNYNHTISLKVKSPK